MKDLEMALTQSSPPWTIELSGPSEAEEELFQRLQSSGLRVFRLNGTNCRTLDKFYDQVTRTFELPAYFGRNFNALEECLTDLGWIQASSFVVVITSGSQMLIDEPSDARDALTSILLRVGESWSNPVQEGESWDRSAVPFHTIVYD